MRMPRGIKKENLPIKMCVTCLRPFNWRKKWERCWDEVTTCSKSCNNKRRNSKMLLDSMDLPLAQVFNNKEGISSDMQHLTIDVVSASDAEGEEDVLSDPSEDASKGEEVNNREIDDECDDAEGDESVQVDQKAAKKAAKKALKAEKRAKRTGSEDSVKNKQKPCDYCSKNVDLLIRCQIDSTKEWKMVCGKCWHVVSGGVVDGDAAHPHYKYGGLWKNRAAEK